MFDLKQLNEYTSAKRSSLIYSNIASTMDKFFFLLLFDFICWIPSVAENWFDKSIERARYLLFAYGFPAGNLTVIENFMETFR